MTKSNPANPGARKQANRAARLLLAMGVVLLPLMVTEAARAQTYTTLFSFDFTNGSEPVGGVVQASNGELYGTTVGGGANQVGTVFGITTSGTQEMLFSFNDADGTGPQSNVVLGTDGDLYGTSYYGGANLEGTVFKITPSGIETLLYSFCSQSNCTDGALPWASLLQAADGNFYGTTFRGGAQNAGTVFRITTSGVLTTLYSFCSRNNCSDGDEPYGSLVQAANGMFYGTTNLGGFENAGTIFRITPGGALTSLYSFCSQSDCSDGSEPTAGLVQGPDGNFYGTTQAGGISYLSTCSDFNSTGTSCGTAFKMTPKGKLTTLHRFCSQTDCTDGANPTAGLVLASDGNLYGTTYQGGPGGGTIFRLASDGALTTLYDFCSQSNCSDGYTPLGALFQDTDGKLYGTTVYGGAYGSGSVFSLDLGISQFVHTAPASGKVGTAVTILGTALTGTTSVSFNGVPATFTVYSSSALRATVPAGATTGTVQVVTPGGTLSSNVPFRVNP